MKWFIVILVLSLIFATSCYSTKKVAEPILPSSVDSGCLYYRDKADQALLFNESLRLLELLKGAKCIHSPSSLFKIGPKAVFLQLETNLGAITFLLPSLGSGDKENVYLQDMKNDLRYQITNVDDIQWLMDIQKSFEASR